MSNKIDGSFINYKLAKEVKNAKKAGLVKAEYIDTDQEQCHISELERILMALDDEEIFVATKTFVKYQKKLFIDIIEYINKEGEKQ